MIRIFFTITICVVVLFVSGCGSIRTLGPGAKADLMRQDQARKTRCETIPRTYSGVAYVICMAYKKEKHGEEEPGYTDNAEVNSIIKPENLPGDRKSIPGGDLLDLFFSGVIDTIVLPYTLFKQLFSGSYELYPGPDEVQVPRKDF